ncbi:hypothetical protein [Paraburkholderia xenovorans]|nr:hypothetical protein [Paraburkholderia xenovorans]
MADRELLRREETVPGEQQAIAAKSSACFPGGLQPVKQGDYRMRCAGPDSRGSGAASVDEAPRTHIWLSPLEDLAFEKRQPPVWKTIGDCAGFAAGRSRSARQASATQPVMLV